MRKFTGVCKFPFGIFMGQMMVLPHDVILLLAVPVPVPVAVLAVVKKGKKVKLSLCFN
jgi:hypothetical protein